MGILAGKIALVTGGTSGLGRATVIALAQAGATVVFTGRNAGGADETLKRLAAMNLTSRFIQQDVTLEADWARVMSDVMAREGRLDALVNNSGVSRLKPMETLTLEDLRFLTSVNVRGMFLGIKHAFAAMEKNAGQRGSIVNISALNALRGSPNSTAYAIAKGGTTNLARAAAQEGRRQGRAIRVNAIHPGVLFEEGDKPSPGAIALYGEEGAKAFVRNNIETTPMGRLGHPRDIGSAVVFLAGDESVNVTGAEITVDGGRSAGEFATHHGVRSQK
ncbi:MAG: SDR family oxidoreductase [Rhodospirillaceae bacterium]|nr:SDR family oxidoreductase [Rhodospirillaceae bacterium]